MPSRRTSTSAIAAADGVRSASTRQRERMVTDTSSGWVDGAHSRNTVCGARLLDRLEQRVRRALGEPVGVLDQHDLEAAGGRAAGGQLDHLPHLLDRDGQPLRGDGADVGVGVRGSTVRQCEQ